MKPYLVDVPVRINIWIRPECQRKQWDVVKQARPSVLFLQSDGGRNEGEWKAIYQNRKMIDENIDWECTVYRIYEDRNNGMYAMGKKMSELIWSKVDRCIFTEDDYIPSVSFFRFCAELLERYKDDLRIECICGMNHEGVTEDVNADYFFSRQGSIWGTATWRNRRLERGDFSYGKDEYVMKLLRRNVKHNRPILNRIEAYANNDKFEGHVAGGEFWIDFSMFAQNRLQIIPKYNMICNIGSGENSAHFKTRDKRIQRIFNMKTYEYEFPLKHAKYVIPDYEYEKRRNKIIGANKKLPKLNSFFYHLLHFDIKYIFYRLRKNESHSIEEN